MFGFSAIKLAIGAAIIAAVAGAYWYVNDHAYNRGQADTERRQVEVIAEQRKAVIKDVAEHAGKTPAEIDAEARRKCREAGGSEEECV